MRRYKQNEMVDFILDLLETLQKDNDFDKDIAKIMLATGLKQKYPLTRYYIPAKVI